MYRFKANKYGKPRVIWKKGYTNSGIVKPSQVNAGSGTTPTIMDNGLRRDHRQRRPDERRRLPDRRRKLKKGEKRMVCKEPIFAEGASATENSLITAGRSLIVENNYGYQDPFGPNSRRGQRAGLRPRRRERKLHRLQDRVDQHRGPRADRRCRSYRPRTG